MMEQNTGDLHDDGEVLLGTSDPPVVCFERSRPYTAAIDLTDGGVNLDPAPWREMSPEGVVLDAPGRSGLWRHLTGTSLAKIRRDLAQIWRVMLASRIDEALLMIEQLELRLHDVPQANARRYRGATQLLRAAGFAFQDDSLAVLPVSGTLLFADASFGVHCPQKDWEVNQPAQLAMVLR
jgi:hypothetical protein